MSPEEFAQGQYPQRGGQRTAVTTLCVGRSHQCCQGLLAAGRDMH